MSARFTFAWTQTAVDDLLDIIDLAAERDGAAVAERLAGQLAGVVAGLETMPLRCRVVPALEAEGIGGTCDCASAPTGRCSPRGGPRSSCSR